MRTIARQLAQEFPASNERTSVTITPLKEQVTADAARALILLLGAAVCVLLITCANVATLLLARSSQRRREIAVRLALGADNGRVIRQLLTESFLLACAGGIGGLGVAYWGLRALTRFVPPALSTSVQLHLDTRALIFATMTTAATAISFGLAPAVQLASRSVIASLRTTSGTSGDRRGSRLRQALVVGEMAIALLLVIGAALLVETLVRLRTVDAGFRADHVLTAEISAPYPKYADAARRQRFYGDLLARVRALPGVERAGLTSDLPYTSRGNYMGLRIEHQDTVHGLGHDALFRLVSADYLQTMGARLLGGRFLDERDREGATPVVVVNEALARQYWPNGSALGRRIDAGTGDSARLWMMIVGIVDDIKERGLDFGPKPAVTIVWSPFLIEGMTCQPTG